MRRNIVFLGEYLQSERWLLMSKTGHEKRVAYSE